MTAARRLYDIERVVSTGTDWAHDIRVVSDESAGCVRLVVGNDQIDVQFTDIEALKQALDDATGSWVLGGDNG